MFELYWRRHLTYYCRAYVPTSAVTTGVRNPTQGRLYRNQQQQRTNCVEDFSELYTYILKSTCTNSIANKTFQFGYCRKDPHGDVG